MKMKWNRYICLACISFALVGCGSKKVLTDTSMQVGPSGTISSNTGTAAPTAMSAVAFVEKVVDNQVTTKNIVGDMTFDIKVGSKDLSVPGSVHMRKDEVVRLQLFIPLLGTEIGRLELTPDYVLVIDRLHKEYVQANYNELEFMKNNGLNFYSLQALFWNELTMPGTKQLTSKDYRKYDVDLDAAGENLPISLKKGNMTYKWQANKENALISNATVNYVSNSHGSSDLTWDYSDFTKVDAKQFPANQMFKFTTTSTGKKKTVEVNIKMKSVKTTEKWETKTTVSSKYKKVQPENVLGKLLGM